MTVKSKIRYMGGVICSSSAVDQTTQNLSAFSVIDQINVTAKRKDSSKPIESNEKVVAPIQFQVITMWKRADLADSGKDVSSTVEAELLDADGRVLHTGTFDLPMPATIIRSRYILNIQGLPITGTGEYCFQFRTLTPSGDKSEVLARLCIDVVVTRE